MIPLSGREERGGGRFVGRLLYLTGRAVVWAMLRLLARPSIEGRPDIPRRGALLVVANHASYVDPMLLAIALPRPLAFLAKEELFHPAPWGCALRAAGIIPVRRGRADRQALDRALAVLHGGGALAVFAEGTRSADGRLQQAEPGVGMLAARSGAPILPVALLGTEHLRSLKGFLTRPHLIARCGPVWQPVISARGGSVANREIADGMMARMAALMPESRRGAYADGLSSEPAAGPMAQSR